MGFPGSISSHLWQSSLSSHVLCLKFPQRYILCMPSSVQFDFASSCDPKNRCIKSFKCDRVLPRYIRGILLHIRWDLRLPQPIWCGQATIYGKIVMPSIYSASIYSARRSNTYKRRLLCPFNGQNITGMILLSAFPRFSFGYYRQFIPSLFAHSY